MKFVFIKYEFESGFMNPNNKLKFIKIDWNLHMKIEENPHWSPTLVSCYTLLLKALGAWELQNAIGRELSMFLSEKQTFLGV